MINSQQDAMSRPLPGSGTEGLSSALYGNYWIGTSARTQVGVERTLESRQIPAQILSLEVDQPSLNRMFDQRASKVGAGFQAHKLPPQRRQSRAALRMLFRVAERWRLLPSDLTILLDLDDENELDLLRRGARDLSGRDRQDRVANVIAIYVDLHQILRSDDEEISWLKEPRDDLSGQRPIDLLLSGRLEDMIELRRYVEFLAGR